MKMPSEPITASQPNRTAASIATARQLDDAEARRYVAPAFVAMHVGWGLGFWSGVARLLTRRGR